MSKKRRYQSVPVNSPKLAAVLASLVGRVVVGLDIAKTKQFGAFMDESGSVACTVRWEHPRQSTEFLEVLEGLRARGCCVEAVMEPSSTYGDALRAAILERGIPVFRINPKRSHDAAEVFDGVPSLHDAKSAAIIAKLHMEGLSEEWPVRSETARALAASLRVLAIYEEQFRKNRNRLEALLARHWPELPRVLDLGSATLIAVVEEFGSPQELARFPDEARATMKRVGGHFLDHEKVERVLESAPTSFGLEPTEEERRTLQKIAQEAQRCRKEANAAKRRVESLTEQDTAARRMRPVVGKTTAAVLIAAAGDPAAYHCAAAYRKALGLNLKEHSSGDSKGALRITKRGPGIARLFLYLAALRLLQHNHVVRAWYSKKVKRLGGTAKSKAVIAIMRKLALALWHVAGGAEFDATKLFDVTRLSLRAS